ncbi:MAG: PAS domain-containing sensor histidine kinase [Candidatus Hodarchaeales archaeon]
MSELLGYRHEDIINHLNVSQILIPEDRERAKQNIYRRLRGEDLGTTEYTALRKDGSTLPVLIYASPIIHDNKPIGLRGIVLDISDRKQAEDVLLKEKEKFKKYLEITGTIIVAINADKKVNLINKMGRKLLGYEEHEIIGKNWFNHFLPARFREVTQGAFDKIMGGEIESVEFFENPILTKNREERLIAWHNTLLTDDNGKIIGTLSSGQDITDQKQLRETIKQIESQYHSIFEEAPISLWVEDFSEIRVYLDKLKKSNVTNFRDYFNKNPEEVTKCAKLVKILDVNQATLDLHKAKQKSELLGNLDEIFSEESFDAFREELIALADGKTRFTCETVTNTLLGERIKVTLGLTVPEGYENTLSRVLVSSLDITERKQIEERLKRQKEELSDFAHFMAHDIRNSLSAIEGYVQLIENENDKIRVKKILNRSKYMKNLLNVSLTLADAGLTVEKTEKVDLNQIVSNIGNMIIPANILFTHDLLPTVPCDRDKISQIFKNLIENAIIHGKPEKIEIKLINDNEDTSILVSNNGQSFPPDFRNKVFSESISTRKEKSGLGLIIVKKIIDAHNWKISLHSSPEMTTFQIIIPKEQQLM